MPRLSLMAAAVLPPALVLALAVHPDVIDLKIDVAFADLALLHQALVLFKTDNDRLPTTDRGLKELTEGSKPILEQVPQDPWSHAYAYVAAANGRSYSLYSIGRNGVDEKGGGDDVIGRDKNYSCAEYGINCGPTLRDIVQLVSLAIASLSALVLLVSLGRFVLRWVRRSEA